jgi:hypothetical protein
VSGRHVPGCTTQRCDPYCPTGLPGTCPPGGGTASVTRVDRVLCRTGPHPDGRHVCPGCALEVFTCPRCRRTSPHPKDAEHGYCGACHAFTGAG